MNAKGRIRFAAPGQAQPETFEVSIEGVEDLRGAVGVIENSIITHARHSWDSDQAGAPIQTKLGDGTAEDPEWWQMSVYVGTMAGSYRPAVVLVAFQVWKTL